MRPAQRERLLDFAKIIHRDLGAEPIVGNISRVPHRQVEYMAKLIDQSGVVEKLDAWYWEDHGGKKPGGVERIASTRTILILYMLLTVEHSAQLVDDMAKMVAHRLSNQSRQYLGLWEPNKRRKKKNWYWPLYHATTRLIDTIDPKPAKGRRRKFPTLAEIEQIRADREKAGTSAKQVRLDWVANRLVEMTVKEIPEEIFETWDGDTTIDATVVPVYGKRGAPWSRRDAKDAARRGALEFDANWYLRTGRHDITDDHKKAKKAVFGYDATVVAMTAHDPNDIALHPLLVLGIGLTIPAAEVGETGIKVYNDLIEERGYRAGRATGDRAYGPGTTASVYQIPMRQHGYELYGDYKTKQLGKHGGHYKGAPMIEGGFYCPNMPDTLVNATIEYRAGNLTLDEYRRLIERRLKYKLRPKEAPDEKGRVPMMCPARGPGATAECPFARAHGGVKEQNRPDDELVEIVGPQPTDEHGGLLPVCTNKSSVSFPIEAGAKMFQTGHYGSQEWADYYHSDRSTIEGKNAYLKDGAREALGDPTRRRLRGYAAQFFLIALSYAAANLRALEKYRDELIEPETDEQLETYFDRKREKKLKRKAEASSRANSWDNFQERQAEEDAQQQPPPPEDT